jgi:hypothetical protein
VPSPPQDGTRKLSVGYRWRRSLATKPECSAFLRKAFCAVRSSPFLGATKNILARDCAEKTLALLRRRVALARRRPPFPELIAAHVTGTPSDQADRPRTPGVKLATVPVLAIKNRQHEQKRRRNDPWPGIGRYVLRYWDRHHPPRRPVLWFAQRRQLEAKRASAPRPQYAGRPGTR